MKILLCCLHRLVLGWEWKSDVAKDFWDHTSYRANLSYSGVDSGLDAWKGLFFWTFFKKNPRFGWLDGVKRLANVDTDWTRARSVFVLNLLLGERRRVPLATSLNQVNGNWVRLDIWSQVIGYAVIADSEFMNLQDRLVWNFGYAYAF